MRFHNKLSRPILLCALTFSFTNISAESAIVKITHAKGQQDFGQMVINYDDKGNIVNTVCTRQDGYIFTRDYSYMPAQQVISMTETFNGPENEILTFDIELQDGLISRYVVNFDGESYVFATCDYNSERHITKAVDYSDEDESVVEYAWQDDELVSYKESWDGLEHWWNDFTYSDIPSEPLLASLVLFGEHLEDIP